jgi:hypothetical protein
MAYRCGMARRCGLPNRQVLGKSLGLRIDAINGWASLVFQNPNNKSFWRTGKDIFHVVF